MSLIPLHSLLKLMAFAIVPRFCRSGFNRQPVNSSTFDMLFHRNHTRGGKSAATAGHAAFM